MPPRMLLRAIAVIVAVCCLSLLNATAFAQALPAPDVPAKPDRDAPFPPPPDPAGVVAAAANLPGAVAGVDQWSKLVYQSFRDGNWEIYLTKGDGSAPVNLSKDRAADARPALNHGATRVAFNSNRNGNAEIYVVNIDGTGLTRLTNNKAADFDPDWSPDGSRIVFVSDRTGNNELWIMNADGTSPIQLTFDAVSDSSPAWSPDGQWIAWKKTNYGGSSFHIMHPDGSEFRYMSLTYKYAGEVHWAPGSDRLVFDGDVDHDDWNELVEQRLVDGLWDYGPVYDVNQPLVDLWAGAYAPDGRSMAFTLVQYVAYEGALYLSRTDILNLDLRTGSFSLFPGSGTDMNPSWMGQDTAAPSSRVAPLPEFVRFGLIPIPLEGVDSGPSGVRMYDVQCALAASGPWLDVASNAETAKPYLACGELESTIWLRSRAKDYAGNVEAWSPGADASTRYFLWEVHGRAIDNRSVAVPKSEVLSNPSALTVHSSDNDGDYQILYTSEQTHTLSMTAPGYGVTAPASLRLNADIQLDFFLPPVTELIENGSFEDGLAGWAGDGTAIEGTVATGAHSGSHGLVLGSNCPLTCLSAPVPFRSVSEQYRLASDGRGNLHVVTKGNDNSSQLHYFVHSIDSGQWSEPEVLPPLPPDTRYLEAIAIDGQGVAHVVVNAFNVDARSWSTLWHTQKPPGGAWTPFTQFAQGRPVLVIGDPTAGLHVLTWGRYYYRLTTAGSWRPEIDICDGTLMLYATDIRMAVASNGVVHFAGGCNYQLMHRTLSPQGVLSARVEFGDEPEAYVAGLVMGPQNEIHLLRSAYYMQHGEDGVWTRRQAYALDGASYPVASLFSDKAGRLHVFGQNYDTSLVYIAKTPDAGWLPPQQVNMATVQQDFVSVSPNGILQLLVVDDNFQLSYQSSPIGSRGMITSVSQAVTLPAQIVHPTLSFFHKAMSGDPQGAARLSVRVDDGINSTAVFSTPAAGAWTQGWVDMEPWLGKTVTVTFAVEQADAEPLLSVYLDDISLGEWTTPVISEVAPAQIYADWAGAAITVRGQNFTANSALYLGATRLDAVTFVDEYTLQATLPASLLAGSYDVHVENADGRQNVAPGGFTLGAWGYLPVVRK